MKLRLGVAAALALAAAQSTTAAAQATAAVLPWEVALSIGDIARSASVAKVMGVRTVWNDRVNLHWGLRGTFFFGDGVPHPGVGDDRSTVFVPNMQSLAANVMIGAGIKVGSGIELGMNVDLTGLTLGTERNAVLQNPGIRSVSVAPVWFNAFGFGSERTRGSLNSQLYLMYEVSDEWKLKVGYSNLWTDYALQNPLSNAPIRYRSSLPTILIGGRYTPKD